ncbi:hypothetical protein [Oerskovia enterophila]|uniref:Uncharacterized protein n=1 Tax=Oerskovia enterophila TaxID=43678 RepID=A0A163QU02_9CELL|nr:hypothetical protein [Oerskovia enterophila]KZM34526.1 hypothetical protein OJAG_28250 [Oerskovia enterophila]
MEAEWAAVVVAGVAGLISLGSVAVAIIAVSYSRGQRDATERQAVAAEAQVDFMRRQVELMESSAAAGHPLAAAPDVPPWTLQYARGDMFTLTNGGTRTAFDVRIDVPEDIITAGTYAWPKVDPRASVSFLAAFSMASRSRSVTVRWTDEPAGPELEWTTDIPFKQ